jgi:hypothetical protein
MSDVLVGVIGSLAGVLIGIGGTLIAESVRQRYLDRTRHQDRRRDVYARLSETTARACMNLGRADTASLMDPMLSSVCEIRIIASDPVRKAAEEFQNAVADAVFAEDGDAKKRSQRISATKGPREAFEKAARTDLGVDD